jgi:hypothetical protein
MAPPPEYNLATQALQQKDPAKAEALVAAIVTKFKGLPTDWAQHATGLAADLALQKRDIVKAELAYADFNKLYPGTIQGKVGTAAIAAAKKNFDTARELIAPILEDALKVKDVPAANRYAYSRAFFVSGQVKEADGKLSEALEDYLRTVTIYYHDVAAVAAAKDRAEALRKEKITVP